MDACFLSIIIPAYNAGKTIARTLESISDLLSPEIEIIVVDDGSTDETSEAIKPFVSRFLQLQSIRQNHSGVSVARNTGISYAQGKYIWFVDADDVVDAKVAKGLLEKIKSADYDFIWFSTVLTEMPKRSAISLFVRPSNLLRQNISRQRSGNSFIACRMASPVSWLINCSSASGN